MACPNPYPDARGKTPPSALAGGSGPAPSVSPCSSSWLAIVLFPRLVCAVHEQARGEDAPFMTGGRR